MRGRLFGDLPDPYRRENKSLVPCYVTLPTILSESCRNDFLTYVHITCLLLVFRLRSRPGDDPLPLTVIYRPPSLCVDRY